MHISSFTGPLLFVLEIGSNGELLIIHNISRYDAAVYECVAENGIGTEARRKMKVTVQCKYPQPIRLGFKK